MKNRLLYHHHIVSRDETETIRKIYNKQKKNSLKGDWFHIIEKDFAFLGIELNEHEIKSTNKCDYKKKIRNLLMKAAFAEYMKEKDQKSKLNNLTYDSLKIQPYLTKNSYSHKEKCLLYSLRSRSHPAKSNYKKMYQNNMQCSFGCLKEETQFHVFQECEKTRQNLDLNEKVEFSFIYGKLYQQKAAISQLLQIEENRVRITQNMKEAEEEALLRPPSLFPQCLIADGSASLRNGGQQSPTWGTSQDPSLLGS